VEHRNKKVGGCADKNRKSVSGSRKQRCLRYRQSLRTVTAVDSDSGYRLIIDICPIGERNLR
jgi:hypothetical protein